nr:GrpB family protein [Erythrobacter sp. EC-HK427]
MSGTVSLVPYTSAWPVEFTNEASAIRAAIGLACVHIHHIGSTAVPGLLAKPVIDILVETETLAALDAATPALAALGYTARGEYGIAGRRYFAKSDREGQRSHHLHAFTIGAPEIARHLAFRDYLRTHDAARAEYAAAKCAALQDTGAIKADYQSAKSACIARLLEEALTGPASP